MSRAFIVVDVLNDFMPGGALPVPEGDAVIEPINRFVGWCNDNKEDWIIIAVCDWHSENSKHFEKWPIHAIANTIGSKFHPDIKLPVDAIVVYKGIGPDEDVYSAFDGIACNGFSLDKVLKIFGITEIFIGGLATDYCVLETVLDAVKNGYKAFVLLDACRALTPEGGKIAVEEMKKAGVVITITNEAVRREEIAKYFNYFISKKTKEEIK